MTPTYEDLQDELLEWLRPLRSTVLGIDKVQFDTDLGKKCESILPSDPVLLLGVAMSNPKLRMINFEGSRDVVDVIGDNIYRQLYLFGWEWLRQTEFDQTMEGK